MFKLRLSILLSLILSVTILIAFFVSYSFLQNEIREDIGEFSQKIFLEQYSTLSKEVELDFRQVKNLTIQTAQIIENRLSSEIYTKTEIEAKFIRYLVKKKDGSYRTVFNEPTDSLKVHSFFTNRREPSLLDKKILIDGKEFFEPYARGISKIVFNTYFTTNDLHWDYGSWDWPLTVPAEENFREQPWYYMADDKHNKNRKQLWTPVYFDDVNKKWLISSLCPVYLKDKFVGVVGHDVLLEDIINLTKKESYNYGTMFYLDNEGAIIAHPETNNIIEKTAANNATLNVKNLKDSNLNYLLDSIKGTTNIGNSLIGNKNKSLIFYAPLKTLQWTLVYVIDTEKFDPLINNILDQITKVLLIVGLATIIIILFVLYFFANKPLFTLQSAMLKVKHGEPGTTIEHEPYLIELKRLTRIFNSMSEALGLAYKKLEISKKQLIDIIDSAPILMILLDEERKALRINESGLNIFGIYDKNVKGKLVGSILNCSAKKFEAECENNSICVNCKLRDIITETIEFGINHKKVEVSFVIENDNEKMCKNLLVSTSLIAEDGHKRVLVAIDDITERVKTDQLKQEIELSKKSANLKQQFLANMSHEMRTPMTGIIGMTDFLNETNLDTQQKEFVSIIKSSSENLLYLINDILDVSKIEQGQMVLQPSPINIRNLFKEVIRIFEPIIHRKELNFESKISNSFPENIMIDGNRFKQVLSNLISNAVKYTKKGVVKVRLDVIQQNNGAVEGKLNVFDTGVGIDETQKENIFKMFHRIDNSFTRSSEGTGLGLPIAKKIAELMNGEIGIESQIGKGSNFWFTFNAEIISDYNQQSKSLTNDSLDLGLRILLAEDKLVNQKVVSLMLQKANCEITIANDGIEVLEKFKENQFDVILMDITMPNMDGITAMKKLREKFNTVPPIIGLSANALEGDAKKYILMGLDDYITKPVKKETLLYKLQQWSLQ